MSHFMVTVFVGAIRRLLSYNSLRLSLYQKQLERLVSEIARSSEDSSTMLTISPPSVLLVDDDESNVRKAQENNWLALRFDPKEPGAVFQQIIDTL